MSVLYDKGRNKFARGEISWRPEGSIIKAFLVTSSYIVDLVRHEFLSEVPINARIGNGGGNARINASELTLLNPVAGICDAENIVFTLVPVGVTLGQVLIFEDGGADILSSLIALIDIPPVISNGADIMVVWDNGADKIFKL